VRSNYVFCGDNVRENKTSRTLQNYNVGLKQFQLLGQFKNNQQSEYQITLTELNRL